MNFELNAEQRMIQDLAREFARREILPLAAQCDRDASFPIEVQRKALQLGLLNIAIPAAHGGQGLGVCEVALVTEQFAYACLGISGALSLNSIIADVLHVAGSQAQRQEYYGRLLGGEFGAYCATEPSGGSDVAAIKTRAVRRGESYAITGSKIWISNAPLASFFVVFAKTDPQAGQRGLSAFIVERGAPGLEVGKPLSKLGQKAAPAAEVFFYDVVVPVSALLGGEGEGFKLAMQVFDRSRPMVAASAVGLLQRCLDESLQYAVERHSMGKPIAEHQAIGHKIAEIGMRLEAARLLTYQAAWLCDAGKRNTLQAAYAKAFAADSAMWAASETVQIFGAMGYSTEYPAEKLFRDAKVLQIYEGTSEIQRNIMLRELARAH